MSSGSTVTGPATTCYYQGEPDTDLSGPLVIRSRWEREIGAGLATAIPLGWWLQSLGQCRPMLRRLRCIVGRDVALVILAGWLQPLRLGLAFVFYSHARGTVEVESFTVLLWFLPVWWACRVPKPFAPAVGGKG